MVRHVVLFRWQAGTEQAAIDAVTAGLAALPGQIPEVRSYRFGSDAGITEGTWDYAVTGDFDDADALVAYRAHPAHQAVLNEAIVPILAERAAVQFEW